MAENPMIAMIRGKFVFQTTAKISQLKYDLILMFKESKMFKNQNNLIFQNDYNFIVIVVIRI